MTPLHIQAFGGVDDRGLHSVAGTRPWDAGQSGPDEVRRDQILDKQYPAFGKLSLPDRLAFAASSIALAPGGTAPLAACGMCLASEYGSFSTDLRYQESIAAGFPSPAIFSSTLPSSAISDVAIYYGIKGPNRVLCGPDAIVDVFACASRLIAHEKCACALVIVLSAVEAQDRQSPIARRPIAMTNSAWAFLLSGIGNDTLRISIAAEPGDASAAAKADDVSLYSLARLCMQGAAGEIPLTTPQYRGRIIITKEI
jgi:hypothetical protein